MSKYKVEITIDVDFDKIFSEVPEELFSKTDRGCDEEYELETIYDALKNSYLYALEKNIDDLASDKENGLYKYLEHHNNCLIAVSKDIYQNAKITKL